MEPGKYKVRAKDWGFSFTGTGKLELGIELVVTEGEHKGVSIWHHLYLTEAALERAVEHLRALGWKGDDVSTLDGRQGGIDANEAEVDLVEEEYRGQVTLKVRYLNALRREREKVPADKLRAFAARIKVAVAQADASIARKRADRMAKRGEAPPAQTELAPIDDTDNVPF